MSLSRELCAQRAHCPPVLSRANSVPQPQKRRRGDRDAILFAPFSGSDRFPGERNGPAPPGIRASRHRERPIPRYAPCWISLSTLGISDTDISSAVTSQVWCRAGRISGADGVERRTRRALPGCPDLRAGGLRLPVERTARAVVSTWPGDGQVHRRDHGCDTRGYSYSFSEIQNDGYLISGDHPWCRALPVLARRAGNFSRPGGPGTPTSARQVVEKPVDIESEAPCSPG